MHECSPGELLTRAAFMHCADQGNNALKRYVALKRLNNANHRIREWAVIKNRLPLHRARAAPRDSPGGRRPETSPGSRDWRAPAGHTRQ